ncbi:MAG TPA: VOC family protein [Thermomicrobiales bacterium]
MTTQAEATSIKPTAVRSIVPCLTFNDQAEEAINFYVSLFANSRILSLVRSEGDGPHPKGKVLHAEFELNGQRYTAMDGGPTFQFAPGFSLVVTCETQEEIDTIWAALTDGGQEGPCGWLTDRFGLAWQVVPAVLGQMMGDSTSGNQQKLLEALLTMTKIDIATLERAYKE